MLKFVTSFAPRRAAGIRCPGAAAQLSTEARSAVPHDVQQLVAIDYRAMQNSTVAMSCVTGHALRTQAVRRGLAKSGLNDTRVEELFFALLGSTESNAHPMTVGIARAVFLSRTFLANFRAQKIKLPRSRQQSIRSPRPAWCLLRRSLHHALWSFMRSEALDSATAWRPSLLTNAPMTMPAAVDQSRWWSILDENGRNP